MSGKNIESMPLDEWISSHHTDEELRSVFFNMDRALKYIHDKGYCIEVFYPTEIEVLNQDDKYIQFNKIMPIPKEEDREKYITEDIFRSSLIQIGIYSNSLKYLTPSFLKENFDEFVQFLPTGDVPYYRGVVQRNAEVYLCEFSLEKRNRDLQDLEKQLGDQKPMKQEYPEDVDLTNQSINDVIYQKISGLSEGAYVNFLFIPILVITMMGVLTLTYWFMGFFVSLIKSIG